MGLEDQKSTLSLPCSTRNCQTVVVTRKRAPVCLWLQGCWIYRSLQSGDLPAVPTLAPACGWLRDSQGGREASGCLLLLPTAFLWCDQGEPRVLQRPGFTEHLTPFTASENNRAMSAERCESEMTSLGIGEILCSAPTCFIQILGLRPRLRKQT